MPKIKKKTLNQTIKINFTEFITFNGKMYSVYCLEARKMQAD